MRRTLLILLVACICASVQAQWTGPDANGKIYYSGNVGIGLSNPYFKLDVSGTLGASSLVINPANANAQIYFKNQGNLDWDLGTQVGEATQNFNLYNRGTSTIAFSILKASNYVIFNNRVGINNNNPLGLLDIKTGGQPQLYLSTSRALATSRNWAIGTNWESEGDFAILQGTTMGGQPTLSQLVMNVDGNLGINNINPQVRLDLGSTQANGLQFRYDRTNNYRMRLAPYWNNGDDTRLDFDIERQAGQGFATVMSVGYRGNVGVGTKTPAHKLEVAGNLSTSNLVINASNGNSQIFFKNNGGMDWDLGTQVGEPTQNFNLFNRANALVAFSILKANNYAVFNSRVGINNNAPFGLLDIKTGGYPQLYLSTSRELSSSRNWAIGTNWETEGDFAIIQSTTNTGTPTSTRLVVDLNGNVGIGTITPDAKLAVKGHIHSQEVRVDMTGAMIPDYVFDEGYKVPSLSSVESYITQHKHLPEIPSAKEIEANGLKLGEMEMLLLKKIEELTLHLISQNKLIEEQHERIEKQSQRIEALDRRSNNKK